MEVFIHWILPPLLLLPLITCVNSEVKYYSLSSLCGFDEELQDDVTTAIVSYNKETLPTAACVTTFSHENKDLMACVYPANVTINDCQFSLQFMYNTNDTKDYKCTDKIHEEFCSDKNEMKLKVNNGDAHTNATFTLKVHFKELADDRADWRWLSGLITGSVVGFVLLVIGIILAVTCCIITRAERMRRANAANTGMVTYATPTVSNQGGFAAPPGSYPTGQLSSGFNGTTQNGLSNPNNFTQVYGSAFDNPSNMKQKYGFDNAAMTT